MSISKLASHVAGTVISDRRLVKDDGQKVTIKVKDYRTKRRTSETATCRFCKGYMTPVDRIDGEKTMLMLSYVIAVMRWLAGKAAGPPEKQPWLLPEHFRQFVAAELVAEEKRRLAADQAQTVASSATFATDAQCRPPPEAA